MYLSNAGTEESAVLNALKLRSTTDPALAYLEWSAGQERATDDPAGWVEANPSIGPPGTGVHVTGSGFAPNIDVVLSWQPGLGTVPTKTNGTGQIDTYFLILPICSAIHCSSSAISTGGSLQMSGRSRSASLT